MSSWPGPQEVLMIFHGQAKESFQGLEPGRACSDTAWNSRISKAARSQQHWEPLSRVPGCGRSHCASAGGDRDSSDKSLSPQWAGGGRPAASLEDSCRECHQCAPDSFLATARRGLTLPSVLSGIPRARRCLHAREGGNAAGFWLPPARISRSSHGVQLSGFELFLPSRAAGAKASPAELSGRR